jgi:hypothetical protein
MEMNKRLLTELDIIILQNVDRNIAPGFLNNHRGSDEIVDYYQQFNILTAVN